MDLLSHQVSIRNSQSISLFSGVFIIYINGNSVETLQIIQSWLYLLYCKIKPMVVLIPRELIYEYIHTQCICL